MDRRRLLLILAVFVAVIGTALVFLYVKGADSRANNQYDNVSVLKATANIAAGETYDSALSAGKMSLQPVPKNQLIEGYQTTTTALKGKISSGQIYAGQQIIAAQWGDGSNVAATTNLPIPKGMVAISVQLSDPDRVAGNVYAGSRVASFVTHSGGKDHPTPIPTTGKGDETSLMLPNVLVLNVGDPAQSTSTTTATDGTSTTETLPKTLLTLAVDQSEAQKIILASKLGPENVTFALLTDSSKVAKGPGTQLQQLFK
jgi:pilus assembly protein CpaB